MFVDVQQEEGFPTEDFDICIVGAGAAGIAAALEFEGTGKRICLLEAGGLEYSVESQSAYKGEVIGLPYEPLDICRLRYFGGTTNHWAGYCHPFPVMSFQKHDWMPHTGWPIGMDDVVDYYNRAIKLLELPDIPWDPVTGWDMASVKPWLREPRIDLHEYDFNERVHIIHPARLGRGEHREALRASENIHVHYNANVVDIGLQEDGVAVDGIHVRTFSGKELTYRARYYVLAASGIENARLMLASNSVLPDGVGNQNDVVGRYFSDHGIIHAGHIVTANEGVDIDLYEQHKFRHADVMIWHESTYESQKKLGLAPTAFRMFRALHETMATPGGESTRRLGRFAAQRRMPDDLGAHIANVLGDFDELAQYSTDWLWNGTAPLSKIELELHFEPLPNPDSRVTLSNELDALGLPRVELDWRITDIDYESIRWVTDATARAVSASGLGRVQWTYDVNDIDPSVVMAKHHIGTTRMSSSPADGVVDTDCKVFGIDNLYVAGSSVFTTCGWGSPTMMLVALAQRLADHLKTRV
jgi:choline dehydrogenase-like flavoprotein